MNPLILLQAQLAAKRGEEELRFALGKTLAPECFRSDVVATVRDAWIGAREAESTIHRKIVGTAVGQPARGGRG